MISKKKSVKISMKFSKKISKKILIGLFSEISLGRFATLQVRVCVEAALIVVIEE